MRLPTFHRLAASAAAAAALMLAAASAQAVALVGITSSNEIARIDTNNVAAATRTAITGLDAGDRFVGIDLRPGNNLIYGITLSNKIYTVNETTGATSFVASLSNAFITASQGWGLDFNPVADFSGAASFRVVGTSGGNYAVNASTGAVTVATSIAAGYSGVSYTNSTPLPGAAPASTSLYYINTDNDTLSVATTGFNNPTITLIGSLGVDALKASGFDITSNGIGYAALNVDAGTSLVTSIYAINLATGAATSVGVFNGTLSGLTVSAVPEPGAWALMAMGLAVTGFVARRRQAAGGTAPRA